MITSARKLFFLVALLAISFSTVAEDGEATKFKGRTVTSVIDEFRAYGYPFAYSTSLVRFSCRRNGAQACAANIHALSRCFVAYRGWVHCD